MSSFRVVILGLVFGLFLVGCSVHPKRMDCEEHLQPINTPAPISKTSESQP